LHRKFTDEVNSTLKMKDPKKVNQLYSYPKESKLNHLLPHLVKSYLIEESKIRKILKNLNICWENTKKKN
jgi:hypothetical protein